MASGNDDALIHTFEGGQKLTYYCGSLAKPPGWKDMCSKAGRVGNTDLVAVYKKDDEYLVHSRPGYRGNQPSELDGKLWSMKKADLTIPSFTLPVFTGDGQPLALQLSADGTARLL